MLGNRFKRHDRSYAKQEFFFYFFKDDRVCTCEFFVTVAQFFLKIHPIMCTICCVRPTKKHVFRELQKEVDEEVVERG